MKTVLNGLGKLYIIKFLKNAGDAGARPMSAQSKTLELSEDLLKSCQLCPRKCRVDRLAGELGFCGIGPEAVVASAGPHFGEEAVLVGRGGSGTIFLAGCNLKCVFCQNYDISHSDAGVKTSPTELAELMLSLQAHGCENINFVTPTHVVVQIAKSIEIARQRKLRVPIVYNCGGYESVPSLKPLVGLVDIYMPDFKFTDGQVAQRLCRAADYPDICRAAICEMHRQVGDLQIENGLATRGLLVRHLVLPNGLAGSKQVLDFLAEEVSPQTFVNVMGQYRPCYRAGEFSEIARWPTREEIGRAKDYARQLGLRLAD